jgi:hypothetical protein
MTRTEAHLALSSRQRRFEWELARDEQTRAAAKLVAGRTHDLLNLIQIVQLATLELEKRCDATAHEFLADLQKAAEDAQRSLSEVMAVARPEPVIVAARASVRSSMRRSRRCARRSRSTSTSRRRPTRRRGARPRSSSTC